MARQMSRARRRALCMKFAEEMLAKLEAWYDAHPDAIFGEIEQQARQKRRELMGEVLAVLINGRDTGVGKGAPRCEGCGAEMEFKEYRDWTVHGLEGDTRLERGYYVCSKCEGQTVFPPGSETVSAGRPLERGGSASGDASGAAGALI